MEEALGFETLKYEPSKSFTKSNLEPLKKPIDVLSIKTVI